MPQSDSSTSEEEKRKKRKRKHKSSSSDTDSSSEKKRREKKKKKKKKKHKKEKKHRKEKRDEECVDVPISFMSKTMAPMTKEEYDKKQSTVQKVFDESTGRHRLIKGDGEVMEEIVSRDRHKEINKQATRGDGNFFQSNVYKK